MKVFWSWQSDTPGNIGRFFVRDALLEAIAALKGDRKLLEPNEREAAATIVLDSDRQGVAGSPDLAATIFSKIEAADVFVADVTLVGQTDDTKRLINSNVAIEYGHAHHALTFHRVLMVQNRYYGDGDQLPFDLRQKSWPLHFTLAPDATKKEIAAERSLLARQFLSALRPYLKMVGPTKPQHEEAPSTFNRAVYFEPSAVIAQNHAPAPDSIDYYFAEHRALYLRLIPIHARAIPLKLADLYEDAQNRRVDLLLRQRYMGVGDRNRFGAITYEPRGSVAFLRTFTQVFLSGELWAVTTEMFVQHQNETLIPTTNVENIFGRVLENFVELWQRYDNGWPAIAVMGGVGLSGVRLGIGSQEISRPIHIDEREVRIELQSGSADEMQAATSTWLDELYDLAAERRKPDA